VDEIALILSQQDGLISRAQALAAGASPIQIARSLRRTWVTVHPGVYINHNGPLTWHQRAWAAVLSAWPAALSHQSAIRAAEGPGRDREDHGVIRVAVEHSRRLLEPPGVRLHRMHGFDSRVQWNRSPPRIRYEEALLDVAADSSAMQAVATLADACGGRRTKAAKLLDHLDGRARIRQREWLRCVLSDIADGTCSVLEHGYLDLVERAHGLPTGQRQALRQGSNGHVYRDVDYEGLGVVVELDGKLFHSSIRDRDNDLERDLDAAVAGSSVTLRLGFGQVYDRGCSTAQKIAAVMQRVGWEGEPTPCARCKPDA
jgi:hypothetical protein